MHLSMPRVRAHRLRCLHGRSPCGVRFARHRINVRGRSHLAGAHGRAHWGSDRVLPRLAAVEAAVIHLFTPRRATPCRPIVHLAVLELRARFCSRCWFRGRAFDHLAVFELAVRVPHLAAAARVGDSITSPCSNRPPRSAHLGGSLRSTIARVAACEPRAHPIASRCSVLARVLGCLAASETALAFRSSRGARSALASSDALRPPRPRSRHVHLVVLGPRSLPRLPCGFRDRGRVPLTS